MLFVCVIYCSQLLHVIGTQVLNPLYRRGDLGKEGLSGAPSGIAHKEWSRGLHSKLRSSVIWLQSVCPFALA